MAFNGKDVQAYCFVFPERNLDSHSDSLALSDVVN